MKLVNHRNGEYRELTWLGSTAATAIIGPFYYMMKGAIGAGFGVVFLGVVAAVAMFIFGVHGFSEVPEAEKPIRALFVVLGLTAWWWFPTFMAYPLVKRHYVQRGFIPER